MRFFIQRGVRASGWVDLFPYFSIPFGATSNLGKAMLFVSPAGTTRQPFLSSESDAPRQVVVVHLTTCVTASSAERRFLGSFGDIKPCYLLRRHGTNWQIIMYVSVERAGVEPAKLLRCGTGKPHDLDRLAVPFRLAEMTRPAVGV